ncbi:MAG TPA: hypothetical protein VFH58_13630 [Acidimicrobiales bacterium]|nr:hypothetical protein [Acidimicrobiales bacterium]
MANPESDPEPTPVPSPPLETAPSATGMVDGDEDEIEAAPPAKNLGE